MTNVSIWNGFLSVRNVFVSVTNFHIMMMIWMDELFEPLMCNRARHQFVIEKRQFWRDRTNLVLVVLKLFLGDQKTTIIEFRLHPIYPIYLLAHLLRDRTRTKKFFIGFWSIIIICHICRSCNVCVCVLYYIWNIFFIGFIP